MNSSGLVLLEHRCRVVAAHGVTQRLCEQVALGPEPGIDRLRRDPRLGRDSADRGAAVAPLDVRRLLDEGFSKGELEVCDELVADRVIEHQDFRPGHADGPEGVKAVIRSLRTVFPDFPLEIADLVDGELVWTRNVGSGTNDGPFMGHPPTGRTIRIEVFDVLRVRDGRLVEHWGVPDRLGAPMQLGHVGRPASAAA